MEKVKFGFMALLPLLGSRMLYNLWSNYRVEEFLKYSTMYCEGKERTFHNCMEAHKSLENCRDASFDFNKCVYANMLNKNS